MNSRTNNRRCSSFFSLTRHATRTGPLATHSICRHTLPLVLALLLACVGLAAGAKAQSVTASISGTVKDSTGSVVVGTTVTATNEGTGIGVTQVTNGQGFYSFQSLPLGNYTVEIGQAGFKSFRQTGLVLDVSAAAVVDVTLQIGQVSEKVEVSSAALRIETANTQMGEVIEGREMTGVPLVTRSYTDLLALQPGVVSQSSGLNGASAGAFTSAGFALPAVSGDLNPGALSVNGMREAANGFILNGVSVQETGFSGAGVIPNLDSIAEFRILTNNFDAEYGNYSGGQINVITKSGTNNLHGNVFEFLRNTNLDARNFFDPADQIGSYHQNQFGGTLGGPIVHDKLFFFADYQGNRKVQGINDLIQSVPSDAEKAGDFSALADKLVGHNVNGDAWASQLTNQLGYTVTNGEPYYTTTCATTAQCVFPGAKFQGASPQSEFSPIATKLLPFIQSPTAIVDGTPQFSTSSQKLRLNDNKFSGRVDDNSRFGLLSAYYYFDNYTLDNPYWPSPQPLFPGFAAAGKGRTNVANFGDTKTFSSTAVNEFHAEFFRLNVLLNQPEGGTGTSLSSLGFTTGAGTSGIVPLAPSLEGIPEIDFNNFTIGVPSRPNQLVENTYQVVDNFSKVIGRHDLRFGGSFHYNQLTEELVNVANGNFVFNGVETGSDFLDFLLGAPYQYIQGQSYPSYGRNHYIGVYGQDSWRVSSNLTFNYGLRWDVSAPWREKYNEIQTLIPGEQSVVFPGAPTGWVFPGDPNVPTTLAPTRYNNFAPRLGLAYSPSPSGGLLKSLFGEHGKTSIRLGYGIFYTAFEGATDFNEIGDAPFGNFTTQTGSTFSNPFITRASGVVNPQLFPAPAPPKNFSASNPANQPPYDTLADWLTAFGGIGSSPGFYYKNRLPYAENFELSVQRQLTDSDLLTISYVGTEGHRLISSLSSNPGNPALCLQLNAEGATGPGGVPCGPFGESVVYTLPNGSTVGGTRAPFGINFSNNSYFATIGNSDYNSLQINWRHTSGRGTFLVGYTYSKAIDDSSGYGEQINPVNARLSRGLSAFDSTHNFVASYNYRLPIDRLPGPSKLTHGWEVSGITRFATGLPVTMLETDDQSLLGTSFGGPIPLPVDTPNLGTSPLQITDPRINHFYFNANAFQDSALGQEGNVARRYFHGPGINNWDMALLKDTHLTERLDLQFRAEFFNVFNHAQFLNPSGNVNGAIGLVTGAAPPRIGQLGLKLNF
jgi:Carboxypeptidase regulatory-like domain